MGQQASRQLSFVDLLEPSPPPARKCNRVTSEVARVDELSNAVLDRSWLEPLQVNIPQGGQHLRHSVPNEVLQGMHDTWGKFLGQVEILRSGKWA